MAVPLLLVASASGFLVPPAARRHASSSHHLQQQSSPEELLEQAARLRQEAEAMESSIDRKEVDRPSVPPKYSSMDDSVWTLNYRFRLTPDEETTPSLGGKVVLRFRPDGYTDVLEASALDGHRVAKVWGWDVEYATDDDKDYLLFSMDVQLPGESSTQRFYFQARYVLDSEVELQEGTVTVKQDVVKSAPNGLLGFLSPKGILAQFRIVGGFVARPTTMTK